LDFVRMQETKGVKMIVCHVCGTENPDGSKFCEGCGVELQAPVALNVGAVAAEIAPVAETAAPAVEVLDAAIPGLTAPVIAPPPLPDDEAALDLEATPPAVVVAETPLSEIEAPAAPVVEVPAAPVVEVPVQMPPLPMVETPALIEDVSPLATVIEAPTIAPVGVVLSSTLDGTVNPKATIETPIISLPKIAKLVARGGNSEGYVLHSERMVVGRFDPSAGPVDIDLSGGQGENYISRRHAEVYLEGGAWMVRDLGSTNGVYVKRAGQAQYSPRIIEPQALSEGDEVAFGNMKFLFVMSDGA
jgi:FHA domain/zinc-ribbon domain